MVKLQEEFNQGEMMMMIQGAFQSIPNVAKRMQNVIREQIQDKGQTREGKKAFVEKCLKASKEVLHLPEKFKSQIYEEFDPVLILNEILEQKLPGMLDKFLDFSGSDENFISMGKSETTELIGAAISEIEDGFHNEEDIIPFLRENVKAAIRAGSEESKAMMAELMIMPPVVAYISRANEQYKKDLAAKKAQVGQFKPQQDEEEDMYAEEPTTTPQMNTSLSLSEQLAKAKTPEEKREILKARY